MVWLLLIVTGALAVMVGVLAALVVRLQRRLARVERRLTVRPVVREDSPAREQAAPNEYVITRVGAPEPEAESPDDPVATVPAPVFADLVLKETVVQTASLVHGLRRALAPETRNRIRFHMRQEVKRSRKQRRADLRQMRRESHARERTAMGAEEGSAA